MSDRLSIFISSTSRDLLDYREAVAKVILRLGMYPIDMATFNSTDSNALQLCYDKVCEADIFIGIYAHRYGYAPDGSVGYLTSDGKGMSGDSETGITHFEYLWALERNIPMLLFVISDTDAESKPLPWPLAHVENEPGLSRLKQFKNLIMSRHVVGFFYSPDHLAAQVATGLASLQTKNSSVIAVSQTYRRDFYKHIQLPPNYVPRTDLLAELRLALLGDKTNDPTSESRGITALHGMGGIGKSVMARALCDDVEIQNAYPDGILWTTLGQEPTLTVKLREWVEALGGTVSENAPTTDSLRGKLAELLEKRVCLLIIDDVWQRKQLETFHTGGPKCHILFTSRDAEIARGLGAGIKPISTMNEGEAIYLLKEWAEGTLSESAVPLLAKIVNRLGKLPLALKLAGAQLQKKEPEKWLDRFDARKLASKRPETLHDSLEQTFGLSMETLQATERRLYAALAIFREDEPIREVAIRHLWSALDNLDEDETQELLDDLASRALLEVVGDTFPRAAILHDLLREFMPDPPEELKTIHQILLNAYQETQTGSGWHTAPDDGYLYNHLTYHLYKADQENQLIALFVDQKWLFKRVIQCEYTYQGYIADLYQAWDVARSNFDRKFHEAKTALEALRLCIRFGLIMTSINSLGDSFAHEYVERAIELGVWDTNRVMNLARRTATGEQKARLYATALQGSNLQDEQRRQIQGEAFHAANAIRNKPSRKHALKILLEWFREPYYSKSREMIDYLETETPTRSGNSLSLSELGEIPVENLEEIIAIEDEELKVKALNRYIGQLKNEADLELLVTSVEKLGRDYLRSVGSVLAPKLSTTLLQRILKVLSVVDEDPLHINRALRHLSQKTDNELAWTCPDIPQRFSSAIIPAHTNDESFLQYARTLCEKYMQTNDVELLPSIWDAMIRYCEELRTKHREYLVRFCTNRELFSNCILSPAILEHLEKDIAEICVDWEWL